jgi:hypothetical protein
LIDEGTKEVGMWNLVNMMHKSAMKKHKKKKHNAHDTKVGMIEK